MFNELSEVFGSKSLALKTPSEERNIASNSYWKVEGGSITGAIILPTKTMRCYYKGNPSKLP